MKCICASTVGSRSHHFLFPCSVYFVSVYFEIHNRMHSQIIGGEMNYFAHFSGDDLTMRIDSRHTMLWHKYIHKYVHMYIYVHMQGTHSQTRLCLTSTNNYEQLFKVNIYTILAVILVTWICEFTRQALQCNLAISPKVRFQGMVFLT